MILLDTNVLSELMRQAPAPAVIRWVDRHPSAAVFISAVTRAEIELGIALLPDGKRKTGIMESAGRMFQEFSGRCLPFDETAARHYGSIVATRTRAGLPISVEDAQIAAIALSGNLAVATRNTADFEKIEGLDLCNPWKER